MVGVEGSMDALVMKACFEEAKAKELAGGKTQIQRQRKTGGATSNLTRSQTRAPTTATTTKTTVPKEDNSRSTRNGSRKCFNCGLEGHMARVCPYPKSSRGEQEAHGKRRIGNVMLEEPDEGSKQTSWRKISELRQELQEAELAAAITEASGVLSVVKSTAAGTKTKLGPTVFAPVTVNGVATEALVDTGSPATIISLGFVLKVLVSKQLSEQTADQWRVATHQKFTSPEVSLQNYGGHIIAQIKVSLSQGNRHVNTVVLVQKDAPNNLLLGTDVQPHLRFALIMERPDGKKTDLSSRQGEVPSRLHKSPKMLSLPKSAGHCVETLCWRVKY